ncbi:polyamine ABC transporter substrate-binding protein [Pseudomonas monteilii]|uniref:polyamine ABC transporter substrate-binding protein n=1 Tax=Pseudomonas monteilii TaxID=76759 RepID=UPI00383B072A
MAIRKFVALVMLAGLCGSSQVSAEGNVVNVYNWADYVAPSSLAFFRHDTGIEPHYDIFDANEVLESKLMAGHSGYDVVVPSNHYLPRLIKAGALAPLDRSLLPNFSGIDDRILRLMNSSDRGNRYAVPYLWGSSGIAYNQEKVSRVLGVDHIDSWGVLFDPAMAKRLSACGIAMMGSPDEVYGAALNYLGVRVSDASVNDYDAATVLIRKVRPYITYFHSSKYVSDLANGNICIAMSYSGDAVQAMNRAAEAGGGKRIEYVIPKEGGSMWVDVFAIPSDARHKVEAHAFINFMISPEHIAQVTQYTGYANACPSSQRFLPADIHSDEAIYPSSVSLSRLHLSVMPSVEVQRYVTRAWNSLKKS